MDDHHFVIIQCGHLANGCTHRFDIISLSIMSGHNKMRYTHEGLNTIGFVLVYMQTRL